MFVQPLLIALKCIPWAKYEKNLLIMPVSLLFFHNTRPNLAQILPQDHIHFVCFAGFQWNMLGDLININNINCNLVASSEKSLLKPLKIAIFGLNLRKKRGQYGPHKSSTACSVDFPLWKPNWFLYDVIDWAKVSYISSSYISFSNTLLNKGKMEILSLLCE